MRKPKKQPNSPRVCGGCTHYTQSDEKQGNCRRFPPTVCFTGRSAEPPTYDPQFVSLYPQVRAEMGACGEFKA